MSVFLTIPIFAFCMLSFVWIFVLGQQKKDKVNRAFLVFTADVIIWVGLELLLAGSTHYQMQIIKITSFFWVFSGLFYLSFAYTLAKRTFDIFWYGALLCHLVAFGFAAFTDCLFIGTEQFPWGVVPLCEPIPHLMISSITAFSTGYGTWLIHKKQRQNSDALERRPLSLIVVGTIIGMAVIATFNVILPDFFNYYGLVTFGSSALSVFAVFVLWTVTRYNFFSISVVQVAEELFEDIKEGIILLDRSGTVIRVNSEARRTFGDSIVGHPINAIFKSNDLTQPANNRYFTIKKDGEERVLSLSSSESSKKGKKLGNIIVFRDVTAQKQAEAFLQRSNDDLEKEIAARTEALQHAKKMEAIGILAGSIAHDFNNLLAAILGFTHAAKSDLATDHPVQDDLEEVIIAGKRAREIIRQVLAYSHKEDANQTKEIVDLSHLVNEALDLLAVSIPKNIEIVKDVSEGCYVDCDSGQMNQLVMNLCTNAFHSMRQKSTGRLSVLLKTIEITKDNYQNIGLQNGRYTLLEVSDTGCGIEEAVMKQIYDPFFTTKAKGEGSGLGLSTTVVTVQNCDGLIDVKSKVGVGSTFSVYFPLNEERLSQQPLPEMALEPPEVLGDNQLILLVDDEEQLQRMGKRRLEQAGYRVEVASDGQHALDVFSAAPNKFDLVITDFTMPIMTGVELAEKILKIRPQMPIILISGYVDVVSRAKVQSIGIKAFLAKPVASGELIAAIQTHLN